MMTLFSGKNLNIKLSYLQVISKSRKVVMIFLNLACIYSIKISVKNKYAAIKISRCEVSMKFLE